jgi:hypothetical protein
MMHETKLLLDVDDRMAIRLARDRRRALFANKTVVLSAMAQSLHVANEHNQHIDIEPKQRKI